MHCPPAGLQPLHNFTRYVRAANTGIKQQFAILQFGNPDNRLGIDQFYLCPAMEE